jgi:hypothetical protein
MLVYRLDFGLEGKPIYNNVCMPKHNSSENHPIVFRDLIDNDKWSLNYNCACGSLDKLITWFYDYWKKMIKEYPNQVFFNVYETNDILETYSNLQLMFNKSTAELVFRCPVGELTASLTQALDKPE